MDKKNSVMGNLHKLEYRPVVNRPTEPEKINSGTDNLADGDEENFSARPPEPAKRFAPVQVAVQLPEDDTTTDEKNLQQRNAEPPANKRSLSSSILESSFLGRQSQQPVLEPPVVGRQSVQTQQAQQPTQRNSSENLAAKMLKDAMLRRIEDYRLSRRDLISRITVAQAEMSRDIGDMERVLHELEDVHSQLSVRLKELESMPDLQESDAADQTLVGTESHKLEQMRLDIIRTIARAERSGNQHEESPGGGNQPINLDSVTLGQILRYGFGLTLPLMIVMIITALIVGFAFIGAFCGAIRW